jgi:hypothetical protein
MMEEEYDANAALFFTRARGMSWKGAKERMMMMMKRKEKAERAPFTGRKALRSMLRR